MRNWDNRTSYLNYSSKKYIHKWMENRANKVGGTRNCSDPISHVEGNEKSVEKMTIGPRRAWSLS